MTTPAPESRDPVAVAENLTGALQALAGRVEALAAYGKRNRRLIVTVVVSLTLDIALTVAVTFLAIQAHDTSVKATSTAASNLALCQAGNNARAQQVGLWTYVIKISGPPKTERQAEARTGFLRHIELIFKPRDCSHLGG